MGKGSGGGVPEGLWRSREAAWGGVAVQFQKGYEGFGNGAGRTGDKTYTISISSSFVRDN